MRDSFTKGIMSLMVAVLLISLLPAAFTLDDAAMNNTTMNNTTLKNIIVSNKTDNIMGIETNQSVTLPEGLSVLHIGKGLNGGRIGMNSLNRSNIAYSSKFQTSHGSNKPELALNSPVKPIKDLEKIVFICNIL